MKRILSLILLLFTLSLMFTSCGNYVKIEKPEDTNLEYWLLDKPNKKEWTELPNSHWLDDKNYLDARYEAVIDENGNLTSPEQYIIYMVGNYPLYDAGVKRITNIRITDPSVYIWGLTINSSRDEVKSTMQKNGFSIHYDGENQFTGKNGHYTFVIEYNRIIEIRYDMTSIIETIFTMGGNLK